MPGTDGQSRARRRRAGATAVVAVALLLASPGCSPRHPSPFAQEFDRIESAPFDAPPGVGRTSQPLQVGPRGLPWFPDLHLHRVPARERLHPRLRAWLADSAADLRVRVLVVFRDPVEMPRLPLEAVALAPQGPLRSGALTTALALLARVRRDRAAYYLADTAMLTREFGARVLGTTLLAQCALAEVELGRLPGLAARNDVVWIDPEASGDPPPACVVPNGKTVADALADLGGAWFRARGYAGGALALFDTGVDASHDMLAPLAGDDATEDFGRLLRYDFTGGYAEGNGPNRGDLATNVAGHGTKTASILVGTDAVAPEHAGMTRTRLSSYQVYEPRSGGAGFHDALLDPSTAHAVARNPIVLAEVQSASGPHGQAARIANGMYELGAAVIAVAGDGAAYSPGCAARVLAAGAYTLVPGRPTYPNQGRGVVEERTKPELQVPTFTLAASTECRCCLDGHSATSGAGPYAAGAALLLRNWMVGPVLGSGKLPGARPVDPGQVYAAMIACTNGRRVPPGQPYDVTRGAGRLHLPENGRAWWGKTWVGANGEVVIPIPVTEGGRFHRFDAAIWWPDPASERLRWGDLAVTGHYRYGLALREPGAGGAVHASAGPHSTFESVHVAKAIAATGPWHLGIRGLSSGWQGCPVYWFFMAQP